jgi:hypothetical protein
MRQTTRSSNLTIRVMTRADLDRALSWAADEGWNPGLADAPCFQAADPDGFLMGFVGNEPVASISVVRYPADFGFLGLYIVRPQMRGQGYGFRLWQEGLKHLDGCAVGLDGVVAQQPNYARSGFRLMHRNLRFSGAPEIVAPADGRLQVVGKSLCPAVMAFDRRYFPSTRTHFLEPWLTQHGHLALALVEEGQVVAYGVSRRCRQGSKIGPLFAEREADADILFCGLVGRSQGPVSIDLPEPNRAATALAERYGLAAAFETARMYRGQAPDLPLDRIYGITTFELG